MNIRVHSAHVAEANANASSFDQALQLLEQRNVVDKSICVFVVFWGFLLYIFFFLACVRSAAETWTRSFQRNQTHKNISTPCWSVCCVSIELFFLFFLPCFVWFVLFFSLLCSLAFLDFLCLRVSFNAGGDSCCFSLPLNFLERTGSVFFSSAALVFFPPVPPLSSAPLHPGTVYCQGKYFMTLTGCSSVRPSVRPVGFTLLLTGTMNKWEETREESFCLTTRFHRLGLSCDDPSQHAQTETSRGEQLGDARASLCLNVLLLLLLLFNVPTGVHNIDQIHFFLLIKFKLMKFVTKVFLWHKSQHFHPESQQNFSDSTVWIHLRYSTERVANGCIC